MVLEDYLAIRPQNESRLKKLIGEGRLIVGPWYLQNDFYLSDGEVTVKNLQIGRELANAFGNCSQVGYAPDQFGNISQLPQILHNFGISDFVFARGYRTYDVENGALRLQRTPTEFIWRGADGTECYAVFMRLWYNNAQRIPRDVKKAKRLLEISKQEFAELNTSPYILLMNGVDHLDPQSDVLESIEALRREGIEIEQCSLDRYAQMLEQSLDSARDRLRVWEGALERGEDYQMLKGCWSSRIYLKQAAVRCQNQLIAALQPLCAYLEWNASGMYPADQLRYVWKELLKIFPHDNICGCSRDETHRHMEDSLERILETENELMLQSGTFLTRHSRVRGEGEDRYRITVFNPTERDYASVVSENVVFPLSERVRDFSIFDEAGEEVPYWSGEPVVRPFDVFSPVNLPGVLSVNEVPVTFETGTVQAYSSKSFLIVPHRSGRRAQENYADCENRYYKVFWENGKLCLIDKRTGHRWVDFLRLEEQADRGDSYAFEPCEEAPLITKPTEFEVIERTPFTKKARVRFHARYPAEYDFGNRRRSAETVLCPCEVTIALEENSEMIGLEYRLENRAKDHRVRLAFCADGPLQEVVSDSPYDYGVRRGDDQCVLTHSKTFHNTSFAIGRTSRRGLTVLTCGQHEGEALDHMLCFTLVRGTGVISRDAQTLECTGGRQWVVPENQCRRTVSGALAWIPSEIPAHRAWVLSRRFRTGMLHFFASCDPKKFSGGRFAVQDSALKELYYLDDPYPSTVLPSGVSVFRVQDERIVVTTMEAAKGKGLIVRLVNFSDSTVETSCFCEGDVFQTDMAEREFEYLGFGSVSLHFGPKKIITLNLRKSGGVPQ